jgi:hypothetical protein
LYLKAMKGNGKLESPATQAELQLQLQLPLQLPLPL